MSHLGKNAQQFITKQSGHTVVPLKKPVNTTYRIK